MEKLSFFLNISKEYIKVLHFSFYLITNLSESLPICQRTPCIICITHEKVKNLVLYSSSLLLDLLLFYFPSRVNIIRLYFQIYILLLSFQIYFKSFALFDSRGRSERQFNIILFLNWKIDLLVIFNQFFHFLFQSCFYYFLYSEAVLNCLLIFLISLIYS